MLTETVSHDEVDTQLCAFSNDFSDEHLGGTTFGTIVDRAGLTG